MATMFDPSKVDESAADAFPVAPPGTYRLLVENAELKPNSKGTGRGIQLNLSLLDPPKGVRVRNWINYEHETENVQKRGLAELKRFLAAAGVRTAVDLETIGAFVKNKVVTAELDVEEYQGRKQNKVKSFVTPGNGAAPQAQPRASAPAPAHSDSDVPW
jgi:hypothetical protein